MYVKSIEFKVDLAMNVRREEEEAEEEAEEEDRSGRRRRRRIQDRTSLRVLDLIQSCLITEAVHRKEGSGSTWNFTIAEVDIYGGHTRKRAM
ncbi:hypothetical protein ACLB2K_043035 [Fragaria x ananassa]